MKPFIVTALTPAARKLPHREHEPERVRRPKPVKGQRPIPEARFCSVDECDHEFKAKGMCAMHYQRATRPRKTARRNGVLSVCSECGKLAVARKLCHNHYKQWWYWRKKLGLAARP